jgi:hypothetical protein
MNERGADEVASAPYDAWSQAPTPAQPPMPVVVGVPRSGTTMLRLMLDAHSQVAIPPDTHFLFNVAKSHRAGELLTPDQLFALVTSTSVWEDFGLSKEAYLERIRSLTPFSTANGVRAFYEMYAQRFGKPRWGDKTPRYSGILASIESLLPEARFIHVIRDGRDVALSLRETWFAPAQDMPTLAQFWKTQVDHARTLGARRSYYLEVRYEALVHQTRDTLKQMCCFIDLPFEEGMEAYHQLAEGRLSDLNPHYNPDGSVRVSKERRLFIHRFSTRPPDQARVGRWRHEMPLEEQLAFDRVAGELLQQLGYTP